MVFWAIRLFDDVTVTDILVCHTFVLAVPEVVESREVNSVLYAEFLYQDILGEALSLI